MDTLTCYCFCVPQNTVRDAIRTHKLRTVLEVVEHTNAGMGCRGCWFDIEELIQEHWRAEDARVAAEKAAADANVAAAPGTPAVSPASDAPSA